MSYQPSVYREQGGAKLIVTSSGRGYAQGEIEIQSGGLLDLQSGAIANLPVQSLGAADVATNITNFGFTNITATTTGPTYTLAAPTVIGQWKYIVCDTVAGSSPGTAIVKSNSTGVNFSAGAENKLTFDAEDDAVVLVAKTLTAWRIVSNTGAVALGTVTT